MNNLAEEEKNNIDNSNLIENGPSYKMAKRVTLKKNIKDDINQRQIFHMNCYLFIYNILT